MQNSIMNRRGQKIQNPSEKQSKFIIERVITVEKHFAEICLGLSAYTRKAARIRDKGDELAKVLQTYAMSEKINKSLCQGILNFSRALSLLSDHRDAEVIRLDSKVVQELVGYDSICKNVKDELKHSINVRDKEISRKRNLDKIREKSPSNRQQISVAENELSKSSVDVMRSVRNLDKQVETFEKQKLRDIKSALLDFIQIEMALHAKALEILTASYQDINNIDEQTDFQDFQKMTHALDREFYRSMKIQTSEFPNDLKHNIISHEKAKTRSMGDLFLAESLQVKKEKEQKLLQMGMAQSMDSISSGRYPKTKHTEGIPNMDYTYELETDDESSAQVISFYKNH